MPPLLLTLRVVRVSSLGQPEGSGVRPPNFIFGIINWPTRLLSDAKHLDRDEKIVFEERKELEMSISEQTADMEKQRDSAR